MMNPKLDPRRAALIASLAGLWAISPAGAHKLRHVMANPNWDEPVSDTRWDQRETKIESGVAIIPVIGILVKYASFYDRHCDIVSASWLEAQIDAAEANRDVHRIVLLFDSPGGMVDGSTQVASRIARCKKPIDAIGSDNICSAAYYMASQCRSISLNETGSVGSIGVVCTGMDDFDFWKELGISFVTVSSGGIKGDGHDHKITDALKAEWQRGVDDNYESFIAAVARGRSLAIDDVRRLADGRTFRAAEAASLKLIDRVVDAALAIDAVKQEVITMTQDDFQKTAAANPTWLQALAAPLVKQATDAYQPKVASLEELEAAFPNDDKFVMSQLRGKATMEAAKEAHRVALTAKVADLETKLGQKAQQETEEDPGSAGLKQAVNTAAPKPSAGNANLLCELLEADAKK
jgi:signal peptide peptidase SppA